MILDYDEKFDIFKINICGTGPVYGEDVDGGVIFKDMDTNEVTGCMIYDFMRKINNGKV